MMKRATANVRLCCYDDRESSSNVSAKSTSRNLSDNVRLLSGFDLWQRKTSKNIRRKSLPVICIPRIPEATFLVKTPTYLVTGAGRGLGYGFLRVLVSDPENTVCGLVRNEKAVQDRLAADQITNVHLFEADVTDEAALGRAAEEAKLVLGDRGLDVLINKAAYVSDVTALKTFKDFEHDLGSIIGDTQKSFDTNVFGVLKTIFAFLPLVQKSRLKKIVVLSSGMGDLDFVNATKLANAAPSAISKAALSTMVAKLGAEHEEQGILFMSLCPGLVDTTEGRSITLPSDDLARQERINARVSKYAPGFQASDPVPAADNCLTAIERSTLKGGFGGSFLSHNGTKKWM